MIRRTATPSRRAAHGRSLAGLEKGRALLAARRARAARYEIEPHLNDCDERDGWLILLVQPGREPEAVDVWPTKADAQAWVRNHPIS